MDSTGFLPLAPVGAAAAAFVWVAGCSPLQFPLLPQNRTVQSGRQTADAVGSAARASAEGGERSALYESNFKSNPPSPETGADAGPNPARREETGHRSPRKSDDTGVPLRPREPSVWLIEREGDTREFTLVSEQSDRPDAGPRDEDARTADARALLGIATGALSATGRETPTRPADGEPETAPPDEVQLEHLSVEGSKFELTGSAPSGPALEAYVERLAAAGEIESLDIAERIGRTDAGTGLTFRLTGRHAP